VAIPFGPALQRGDVLAQIGLFTHRSAPLRLVHSDRVLFAPGRRPRRRVGLLSGFTGCAQLFRRVRTGGVPKIAGRSGRTAVTTAGGKDG
jgi:hypothetical protein